MIRNIGCALAVLILVILFAAVYVGQQIGVIR
jgi:hypothetical protein